MKQSAAAGKRVLILGGGSGGLELAAQLSRAAGLRVTLVDREPAHVWKPRLHEIAAGTVSTSLSEMSFYLLGRFRGFRFEQGAVAAIEREAKRVRLEPMRGPDGRELAAARSLSYDVCVVALGSSTPDLGVMGVRDNAVRLDAKHDADGFRDRFIARMIEARETGDPAEVVIVGTGATGTELAAHLRDSERGFLDPEARETQGKLLGITLLEAAPELMPGVDPELRRQIAERLRSLDIKVVTDAQITEVHPTEIRTAKGERWPGDLVVWAAGAAGNPVLKKLGDFAFDPKGRIVVDAFLRSSVDPDIYVLGDSASLKPEGADRPLAATAQAAGQEAAYLAGALPRVLAGEAVGPFVFHNRGRFVSLGRAGAIGKIGFRREDDLLVAGRFAKAAYHGLERQHQWRVLGPVRGTVAILADLASPTKGPALKLHGI